MSTIEEEEFPQFYHLRSAAHAAKLTRTLSSTETASNNVEVSPVAAVARTEFENSSQDSSEAAKEGRLVFNENRKGVSYDRIFGSYLDGASKITVTDPYIRLFFQARNVMELVEMIVRRKAPEDQVIVQLVTGPDEGNFSKQRENLDSIVAACEGSGVEFNWSFDGTGTAHARHIVTDTGWKISLDRGLDIFQQYPMNDAFSLSNRLQEQRAIKQFEIT